MSDQNTASAGGLELALVVEAGNWPAEKILEELAGRAISAVKAETKAPEGVSITFLFTDDEQIRALNVQFRGKDKTTNVLSFPSLSGTHPPDEAAPLGDVALAYETVAREADAEKKPFNDHLCHLIVHGFLHLVGYDHLSEEEAEEMEDLERRVLARLAIADPYS